LREAEGEKNKIMQTFFSLSLSFWVFSIFFVEEEVNNPFPPFFGVFFALPLGLASSSSSSLPSCPLSPSSSSTRGIGFFALPRGLLVAGLAFFLVGVFLEGRILALSKSAIYKINQLGASFGDEERGRMNVDEVRTERAGKFRERLSPTVFVVF
jgi:hypothetical protein